MGFEKYVYTECNAIHRILSSLFGCFGSFFLFSFLNKSNIEIQTVDIVG